MRSGGFTYKNLIVWQQASEVSIRIINTLQGCRNYWFRDQITRSSLSVAANIAEWSGRSSSKEFLQFLSYAQGSCYETGSHLYVWFKGGLISSSDYNSLSQKLFEISKMINSLAAKERKNPKKKVS